MVQCILRYVKGTNDIGIYFTFHSTLDLCAFSNADWADCPTTRCFTTRYCTFLARNLNSWCAKKQHIVSWSIIEVKYSHCQHISRTYMANLYSKRSSHFTLFLYQSSTMTIPVLYIWRSIQCFTLTANTLSWIIILCMDEMHLDFSSLNTSPLIIK